MVFPLFYEGTPRLSVRLFCELVDALYEARRLGAELHVVAIERGLRGDDAAPKALEGLRQTLSKTLPLAPHAWATAGELPRFHEQVCGLLMLERLRLTRFDLADAAVAAAARALGADRLYCAGGFLPGDRTRTLRALAPLGTVYGRTPFERPPPEAKLRPAGFDPVWFLAFTSEQTASGIPEPGEQEETRVRQTFAQAWRALTSGGLAITRADLPLFQETTVRLQWRPLAKPGEGDVGVPLFGAPSLGRSTVLLARAYEAFFRRRPSRQLLFVDDTLAGSLYREYAREQTQGLYEALARETGSEVRFTRALPIEHFEGTRAQWLERLGLEDLLQSTPYGLVNRTRGGLTVYDVVHLVSMSSTIDLCPGRTIVCRATNLTSLQSVHRRSPLDGILCCHGLDTLPGRIGSAAELSEGNGELAHAALTPAWEQSWESAHHLLQRARN
jgi:hypothetical protein